VLVPLEVMEVWAVPYEMEQGCSFCSSSAEPALEWYNQYDYYLSSVRYKTSCQKRLQVIEKETNQS